MTNIDLAATTVHRDRRVADIEDWLERWPGPLRLMSGDKSIPSAHNAAPDHVRYLLDRVRQLEADLADAHRDAMVNRDTANRAHAVIDRVTALLDNDAYTDRGTRAFLLVTQLRIALDAGEGQ